MFSSGRTVAPNGLSATQVLRRTMAMLLPGFVVGTVVLWLIAGEGPGLTAACLACLVFDILAVAMMRAGADSMMVVPKVRATRVEARLLVALPGLAAALGVALLVVSGLAGHLEVVVAVAACATAGIDGLFAVYLLTRSQEASEHRAKTRSRAPRC